MSSLPPEIEQLITELKKLPGVGPKTAERYAFSLLGRAPAGPAALARAVTALNAVRTCSECGNVAGSDPCGICADTRRRQDTLCVVAEASDIPTIEKTGQWRGRYHVLGGLLNPIEGVGPTDLAFRPLVNRIRAAHGQMHEVVLALSPNVEGETTVLYLAKILKRFPKLTITRLARGLPTGAEIEYADEVTLGDALANRKQV